MTWVFHGLEFALKVGLIIVAFLIAAVGFGLLLTFVFSQIVTTEELPREKRRTSRFRQGE